MFVWAVVFHPECKQKRIYSGLREEDGEILFEYTSTHTCVCGVCDLVICDIPLAHLINTLVNIIMDIGTMYFKNIDSQKYSQYFFLVTIKYCQ